MSKNLFRRYAVLGGYIADVLGREDEKSRSDLDVVCETGNDQHQLWVLCALHRETKKLAAAIIAHMNSEERARRRERKERQLTETQLQLAIAELNILKRAPLNKTMTGAEFGGKCTDANGLNGLGIPVEGASQ